MYLWHRLQYITVDSPAVSVVAADELRGLGGGGVEPRRGEGGAQLAEVELAVAVGVEALKRGAHLEVEPW